MTAGKVSPNNSRSNVSDPAPIPKAIRPVPDVGTVEKSPRAKTAKNTKPEVANNRIIPSTEEEPKNTIQYPAINVIKYAVGV